MSPLEEWYYKQPEPARSILLFLRKEILNSDPSITETFSFSLPFFKYKKKMLLYFNYHRKHKKYYVSFDRAAELDFPELLREGRKRFQILLLDENEDVPVDLIFSVLKQTKPLISD